MIKGDPPPRAPSTMPPRSRLSLAALLLSALALLYLFKQHPSTLPFGPSPAPAPAKPPPTRAPQPVSLEAHIMSMCPDARDCLELLVIPAMALLPAAHVNFTLSFIGRPTPRDGGVECPHGPRECLGDMLELCAARLYPREPKRHLGFAMCLSRRYDEIPQRGLVEGCAAQQGVDFEQLNECASGETGATGMDMLRRSVEWSAQQGVVKSCTVSGSCCAMVKLTCG
jgi:Gamma interferon inducible lysosomal thiol reductase (GILT)